MKRYITEPVRFRLEDVRDAYSAHIDDSSWQEVYLPHDWAVEYPFDPKYSSGTGYLPGGTGWYRIHVEMPEDIGDKHVELCFEGVYKRCRVWMNQYYLGEWANGYTPFSFDVSHAIRGGSNLIAVQVRHEDLSDSRWYTGSGIERNVFLDIQDKVYVKRTEQYFKTLEVIKTAQKEAISARIFLGSVVKNADTVAREVIVRNFLNDAQCTEEVLELTPGEERFLSYEVNVENPMLWSIEFPNLMQWETRIYNALAQDTLSLASLTVGIREATLTVDRGFFLNGQEVTLKGVCLHEDGGSFGNAVPSNVWERRLLTLKDMGCNTIRMSHNPHSAELYDLCDRLGFLVIDEIFDEWEGPKNKWWQGHNVYPPRHEGYYLDYPTWHGKDVEAFVKATRNRPGVVIWSIGNEIDYPNDPYCHPSFAEMTGNNDAGKPAEERAYDPEKPNAERLVDLAKDLVHLVKLYDDTRPVTLASAFPELSSHTGLFEPLDAVGYNYREEFYEEDHKRFPNLPIFGSENGHDYDQWKAVSGHPFIAGQCLWTGIDYLGETHLWPEHGSHAGHLTTAGFAKADYYLRQSWWTKKPMVKLATCKADAPSWMEFRSFTLDYAQGEVFRAEVYTNLGEAELFQGEVSLGRKKGYDADGRYVWEVTQNGEPLKAVAYGNCDTGEELSITDQLEKSKEAASLHISLWDEELIADGRNIGQIVIEVTDSDGCVINSNEDTLEVTVEGEARLLHMDNGELGDVTPYKENRRKAKAGRLMAYVQTTEKAGEVRVRVTNLTSPSQITETLTLQTVR